MVYFLFILSLYIWIHFMYLILCPAIWRSERWWWWLRLVLLLLTIANLRYMRNWNTYRVLWCPCRSARAADEPSRRGSIPDVNPVNMGRTPRAWRRGRRGCRLVWTLLQRLTPTTERPRHYSTPGRVLPTRWPHPRYRLSHPGLGQVGRSWRERQHADHTSAHPELRSEPSIF